MEAELSINDMMSNINNAIWYISNVLKVLYSF